MVDHELARALGPLLAATGAELVPLDARVPGDVVLEWEGRPVLAVRLAHLDGALDRLIAGVELDLGSPADQLSREQKQRAVGLLHERGAFTLRRSVEQIAEVLGVSRFTVYNYLDRVDGSS